jgi:hypothetical protein
MGKPLLLAGRNRIIVLLGFKVGLAEKLQSGAYLTQVMQYEVRFGLK